MSIKFKGQNIGAIYLGNKDLQKVYLDSNLVFEKQIIIEDYNLLDLSEENWEWINNSGEASAIYNSADNTISLTYDGTSSFGLNISQPNLILNGGATYKLSCDNIESGTYISINNNSLMALNSSTSNKTFTPEADIINPVVVIWCDKNKATYDNTLFNIRLEKV